jgi:hypothetical protein
MDIAWEVSEGIEIGSRFLMSSAYAMDCRVHRGMDKISNLDSEDVLSINVYLGNSMVTSPTFFFAQ